ncbi:hypothetical protein J7E87_32850 [Streptomyces sp. ISL-1]|uniref:hypothetical protein n=1 Tax=Streptomyces sp. ISL-1 TaxID=2817657 RepID=UPI001BE83EEE|nr:hypothetical protein [Streptomyces sp. ISL-1]MBT2394070.1 hypothetical protein [Streptomyces sp. ISL-1]
MLGLRDGYCRRCLLFLAETEYDIDNIHLTGGDQLWFGGPFAPRMRLGYRGQEGSLFGRRRHDARRLRAVRTSRAARPVSTHLALPGQLEMFHLVRDWSRLNEQRLPALLPGARRLLTDFVAHFRSRGWKESNFAPNVRTLRMLLAHLGAEAPLWEEDVRLLARRDDFTGPRVINYLRLTGRLVPDQRANAALAHARRLADAAPEPFRAPLHQWIDVLCGTGAPPSSSLAPTTIDGYVRRAAPVLAAWHQDGLTDVRAVTREHIDTTLKPLKGQVASSLATALRSLFRALKRQKLIFRDPARHLSLASAHRIHKPLPTDRLHGTLQQLPTVRSRLSFLLAAVHALSSHDQRGLLLDDLDRSRAQLLVRRVGKLNHTLYLDELTSRLLTQWLAERHRRWPLCTNPYLLVSARTAADDSHPKMCSDALSKPLRSLGLQAGRLRVDRILDEAEHTSDPVHLMRQFGLSAHTAMHYLRDAHPERTGPSPLAPAGQRRSSRSNRDQ